MFSSQLNAPDLTGGLGWLNTDKDISLKDLRGKIVLLDFWTFCCINCMHVIPDLKRLEAKYPHELVVVGVHSAKFENEKDSQNIKNAIARYGIHHPVVNDANFAIWQSYGVRAWPTLILIDPNGKIIGQVSGEGHYEILDDVISQLVTEFDKRGTLNRADLPFLKPAVATSATSSTSASSRDTAGQTSATASMSSKTVETSSKQQIELSFPGKIFCDPASKRLFISDSGHNKIIVTNLEGKLLASIGSGHQGLKDGSFAEASFNNPQGLALKDGHLLYIADTDNHAIRLIDLDAHTVKTVAGIGSQAFANAPGGSARTTPLNSPWDLTFADDRLYIAMAGSHQLWVYDLKAKTIEPYAGNGRENIIDGPLGEAALAQPSGITTDGKKLYFADSEVSAVREADIETKPDSPSAKVKTLIGKGLFDFGDIDGPFDSARLQHPLGIVFTGGKLYVADSYNHKIKVLDLSKNEITTLSGSAKPGNATGTHGQFNEPGGLSTDGVYLYVADTNNNRICKIDFKTKSVEPFEVNP